MEKISVSPEEIIFYYIKNFITFDNSPYSVTIGSIDETKENSVGLYLSGLGVQNREVDTGKFQTETVRLTLNIQTGTDSTSYLDGYSYCNSIFSELQTEFNKFVDKNKLLYLLSIEPMSPTLYLGRNELGIHKFSLNFILKYNFRR